MRKSYSIFERLVRKYTGLRVEAEYRFHPARDWAFDFAIPACRLAIEVEGGVHNGGRHIRPDGFVRDMLKYNEAAALAQDAQAHHPGRPPRGQLNGFGGSSPPLTYQFIH